MFQNSRFPLPKASIECVNTLRKEPIYEAVFGFDGIGDNSTISTHIKNIRAKLEHFKISPISTVWGIGYKWE